jgi:chromosomal replication initiation ATPase DnaA
LFNFFDKYYPEWQLYTREDESVIPRQVLQYFLYMQPGWTLERIGLHTGIRDHTTVIHSRNLVRNMLGISDPVFVQVYNKVIEFLNS